jgi:type I restriction enzyme S subunit
LEVKPGYKQTEVGVIPEEWDARPLLSTVRIANGQVSPKVEPYKSMVLVAPDHIESSTGKLLAKETAAEQGAISGKYLFESGDIVYSKIRPYLRKAILADFSGLCSADMYPLKPATDISAGYIFAVILGYRFSKSAESVSVRSGMPKINRTEMADFSLAVPPLPEQRAIAEALSDVDGLLGGLDRLIAKKRDLKQAAIQQLLTGQTRLPGFHGKWEVKTLRKIADVIKGGGLSKGAVSSAGATPCILYGELFTTYGRVISSVIGRTDSSEGVPSITGDVLMPSSTTTTGID